MKQAHSNLKKKIAVENIGKDEMNLLEFCLFSATNRVDTKTKCLRFEDETYCSIEKRKVLRKLTVAFSAEYGRPTPSDDMVLVAMMKLTRDAGFENQRIHFSRYELIKTLKWSEGGRSYDRIDQALNRIMGTHLVWDNAFWDNEAKSWVDRKFNIIDDAHLYDREKYGRALRGSTGSRPKSWFKWSDVMFESFNSGYIKTIDLHVLHSLREVTGRRLYRWLDKHFNNPKRRLPLEISVEELATKKLGFQNVPASHLKRMIQPAINELEEVGIVARDENRFSGKGKSSVIRFRPKWKSKGLIEIQDPVVIGQSNTPFLVRLVELGVSSKCAKTWMNTKANVVERQLKYFDCLIKTGWVPKNAAAWITSAINSDFKVPLESEKQAVNAKSIPARKQLVNWKSGRAGALQDQQKSQSRIADYLNSLTAANRRKLEQNAIDQGSSAMVDRLRTLEREGEQQIAAMYREQLVAQFVDTILKSSSL